MKLAFLIALILLTTPAAAQDYGLTVIPHGGAAGGDALVCNNCDARGFRNIQGGSPVNPPESLNLDIGAGSTANPGDLVLNYDVGRRTLIYDGRKHLLASFGPDGIRFYRRPTCARTSARTGTATTLKPSRSLQACFPPLARRSPRRSR